MITTKVLSPSELTSLLQHIQLQQDQYVFYFTKNEDVLQLMCKKPNGDNVAVFNNSSVNQKYYKSPIQDIHPSGSDYTVINQSYIANGVTNVRYIIEGESNLYSIINGTPQVDNNLEVGSFTYYTDSKNNTYLFYVYDGRQWLPIYVQGGLGDHVIDYHNPHRVTKTQIGLDNVENVKQITETKYLIHINTSNPHNITKEDIGLGNVVNIEQLSLLDYVNHKNANNPHRITKVHVGLDRILQNVIQIPYDEFLRDHIEARNPHKITLQQLGLDKIDVNALQGQTTQKEFQSHIQNKTAHGITKEDIGLGNVINAQQADYQVVYDHINIDRNPHNITKKDIGLGNVRNVQQANYDDYQEHINSQDNPHNITKEDVGLGNVKNVQQVSREAFELHINDRNPHKVTKEQIGLGNVENVVSVSQSDYNNHVRNYDNPHQVTVDNILGKDQIGISLLNLVPQSEFLHHIGNRDNPHNTTKEDIVGLSLAENINQLSLSDYNNHITASNPHNITKKDVGLSLVNNTTIENKPISSAFKLATKKKYLKSLVGENDPTQKQKIIEENYGISYSPYIIDKKFTTDGAILDNNGNNVDFDYNDINNQGKLVRVEKAYATYLPYMIGYEEELNDWYWYIANGEIQRLICDVDNSYDISLSHINTELFPHKRNVYLRTTDLYRHETITPVVKGVFSIKHTLLEEMLHRQIYENDYRDDEVISAEINDDNGVGFDGQYGIALIYPAGNQCFIDKNQNEVLIPIQVIGETLKLKVAIPSLPSDSVTVAHSDGDRVKNFKKPVSIKNSISGIILPQISVDSSSPLGIIDQYLKFTIPANTTKKPREIAIHLYQEKRARSQIIIYQEG